MKQLFFIISGLLFSHFSFAQFAPQLDSTGFRISHEECDDKFFNKVEIIPSLKQGIVKYQDTLSEIFKKRGLFNNDLKATFNFIVTKGSHILDIRTINGYADNEKAVEDILVSTGSLWAPAIQNGYKVCAYVILQIEISNNKLKVTIVQN